MGTYVNMTKEKSADPSSRAVATTNLISLKGKKDAADSLRKLDRFFEKSTAPNQLQLVEGLDFKLSPRQKEALYSARVLLLLHANKTEQVCFVNMIITPPPFLFLPYVYMINYYCEIYQVFFFLGSSLLLDLVLLYKFNFCFLYL